MATSVAVRVPTQRIIPAVILGGAVAGSFDAAYAITYFGLMYGSIPYRIFQYIASGLLGPVSFTMGCKTVVLGVICHYAIATGAAATYCVASLRMPALVRRPLIYGPIFGIGVYVVMNYIVVPLSAVQRSNSPRHLDIIITGILVHMFLIGLPIALIARASARTPDA